jgi:hypothetical protein
MTYFIKSKWHILYVTAAYFAGKYMPAASTALACKLQGFRMSLSSSSHHNSRMSLHDSKVSIHISKESLYSFRVNLHTSRVILRNYRGSPPLPGWLQDEPPWL